MGETGFVPPAASLTHKSVVVVLLEYIGKEVNKLHTSPKDLLEKTKEVFEESRWIQGEYENFVPGKGKGYCLVGAIYNLPGFSSDTRNYVANALHICLPSPFNLIQFNDSPSTTKDDVIKLLDKVIETL